MPSPPTCPQCAASIDGSVASARCPSCGATLDAGTAGTRKDAGDTTARFPSRPPQPSAPAIAAPGLGLPRRPPSRAASIPHGDDTGETPSEGIDAPPFEPSGPVGAPKPLETPAHGVASRSSSALRLQTLMSHEFIAGAVRRLRERMRDQPNGLANIVNLAVLVVLADNEIDELELIALHETVSIVVGDIQTSLARLLINACVAKIRETGLEGCAQAVREALIAADAVEDGIVVAYAAAYLSDGLSIPERGVIQVISEGSTVTFDRVMELRDMVRAAVEEMDTATGR